MNRNDGAKDTQGPDKFVQRDVTDLKVEIATLKEKSNHLATSEDVQKVVTNVESLRGEFVTLKWIGGLIGTAIIIALLKLFSS